MTEVIKIPTAQEARDESNKTNSAWIRELGEKIKTEIYHATIKGKYETYISPLSIDQAEFAKRHLILDRYVVDYVAEDKDMHYKLKISWR